MSIGVGYQYHMFFCISNLDFECDVNINRVMELDDEDDEDTDDSDETSEDSGYGPMSEDEELIEDIDEEDALIQQLPPGNFQQGWREEYPPVPSPPSVTGPHQLDLHRPQQLPQHQVGPPLVWPQKCLLPQPRVSAPLQRGSRGTVKRATRTRFPQGLASDPPQTGYSGILSHVKEITTLKGHLPSQNFCIYIRIEIIIQISLNIYLSITE